MKYYLWIIGCQYNEWDGARIRFALDKSGLIEVKPEDADIIIILACAVRQTAVNRIYGKLKHWNDKKIIISGCVLKTDKTKFEDKGAKVINWTDAKKISDFIGIKDRKKFEKLLNQGNTNSAYIPITTGCNNFCSYCAVPYTRGREVSRNFEDIVKEFKELVNKGIKNIVLIGQNVNSYKTNQNFNKEKSNKSDFAILLEKLNSIRGNFEISFTSNHPKDMSDDIIETVASLPKIKKEIHLPLQSGSDKILKAMNRPYTVKKYLEIANKLRLKNLDITTDVIVGFPGETEGDFQQTVKVCEAVGYSLAYINKYSPREGTAAYKLGDPVPWKEKQRRWNILNNLINT